MTRLVSSAGAALLLLTALAQPAWPACSRTCATRPEGCAKGFGTLAYVVTSCRVIGNHQLGTQELRIHRSGCDPITVLRVANAEPVMDAAGLCRIVGTNHLGTASPVAGVIHRLGVSQDGRAVVFEVTNEFQLLVGRLPLTSEQQGFFYVRADGTGLRRLGPPSRDPTYRLFLRSEGPNAVVWTQLYFSSDGRRVAFTDLAPGPDGVETEQVFTMELTTGERRQVTHLTAAEPPPPWARVIDPPTFLTPRIIDFGYNVGQTSEPWQIDIDGTNLRRPQLPDTPSLDGGGHVSQVFRRNRRDYGIFGVTFPGQAVNDPNSRPYELFRNVSNRYAIQLTNFGRYDTVPFWGRPRDLLFYASADPFGENPSNTCQIFRISPFATGLRQLTHLGDGQPSQDGCDISLRPGCGLSRVNQWSHPARGIVFFSDCNPVGTNPDGAQVFGMRYDGSHIRELTHTRGTTRAADGSVVEVEIPGPVARGG